MSRPRAFGKYVVVDRLGGGGMGVVYRATDPDTGRSVAVKTVRTTAAMQIASLRREARALTRICHPGIVRVLDAGTTQGIPWYAMELVTGPTLRELMERRPGESAPAGSGPTARLSQATTRFSPKEGASVPPPEAPRARLRPGELLEILTKVRRLCAPLAYLHGEGFVHRDLKPENVVWREEHPVLVDFGLHGHFGGGIARERPDVSLEIAGTAAYMAPEQRWGALVDARADLYALGVILHELLTGLPFVAGELAAARLVDDIPDELGELLARLLEQDPANRIGHADVVDHDLAGLGADGFALPAPPPRAYLYRPLLEGRRDTLAALQAAVASARQGRGSMLVVRGESGVGKTRLAMELAADAAARGFDVLVGEHADAVAAAPLAALRPLFLRVAPELAARADEDPAAALTIGVLAPYEPALAALGRAFPAPLPPDATRRRLLQTVEGVLRRAAREHPLFVIVDDLQWADELTLAVLRHLASGSALGSLPVLVVATIRSEAELEAPRGATEIALGGLEPHSVERMISRMLGVARAPAELARYVADHSEGNPLFVAEYLRLALEQGRLSRDRRGGWMLARDADTGAPLPIPRSVKELIERRLAALPDAARQLLQVASALGREMEETVLAEVSGLGPDEAAAQIEVLLRQHLLERTALALRFSHDKVREITYEGIDPADRPVLHGTIADTLERASRGAAEKQATLARQWELAHEPVKARHAHLRAARHAIAKEARSQAEASFRSYLRFTPPPGDPEVRLELVEQVLIFQSRRQEACAELAALLPTLDASERGLVARTQRLLGTSAARSGAYEEAVAWLHRAVENARGLPLEPRILANLADLHRERGDLELAASTCRAALALVEGRPADDDATLVLRTLGAIAMEQGEIGEARRRLGLALESYRAIGDRFLQAVCLGNLANACQDALALAEAGERYGEAIALHVGTGNVEFEGVVRSNHGLYLGFVGRTSEGIAEGERALELLRSVGDPRSQALAQASLGETLAVSASWPAHEQSPDDGGIAERALRHLEEADAKMEELGLDHLRPPALTFLARALRLAGASDEKRRGVARRARTMFDKLGSDASDPGLRLARAALALETDDLATARQEADAALALLRPSERRFAHLQAVEIAARLELLEGRAADTSELRAILDRHDVPAASPFRRSLAALERRVR